MSASPAAQARSLAPFGVATALTAALSALALTSPGWAQVAPTTSEIAAYSGLHAAAARGDVAATLRLAAADPAAVRSRDAHGRTPLHVATFARKAGAIVALARSGAALDALDDERYDAVTIASVADDEATLDEAKRGRPATSHVACRPHFVDRRLAGEHLLDAVLA